MTARPKFYHQCRPVLSQPPLKQLSKHQRRLATIGYNKLEVKVIITSVNFWTLEAGIVVY
jgi:hypothetical protein